jgi:ribosomal protein L35
VRTRRLNQDATLSKPDSKTIKKLLGK